MIVLDKRTDISDLTYLTVGRCDQSDPVESILLLVTQQSLHTQYSDKSTAVGFHSKIYIVGIT